MPSDLSIFSIFSFIVIVCLWCACHLCLHATGGVEVRRQLKSQSSSIFAWIPGTELRLPSLQSQVIYPGLKKNQQIKIVHIDYVFLRIFVFWVFLILFLFFSRQGFSSFGAVSYFHIHFPMYMDQYYTQ